jgi:hypothetical protein
MTIFLFLDALIESFFSLVQLQSTYRPETSCPLIDGVLKAMKYVGLEKPKALDFLKHSQRTFILALGSFLPGCGLRLLSFQKSQNQFLFLLWVNRSNDSLRS